MSTSDDLDALRRTADHVAETRRRLAEGQAEIDRQRHVVADTDKHLSGITRWIEQTERHLGEQRARRDETSGDDLPPAA